MGYQRKQETLRLTFTGQLEGLHVVVRQASPEVMRHVVATTKMTQDAALTEQADAILNLCEAFGQLLASWNLEDEQGQPVPAMPQHLARQDTAFVLALVYGWLDAMAVRAEQLSAAASVNEGELPMTVGG